jgi:hypothetical protein
VSALLALLAATTTSCGDGAPSEETLPVGKVLGEQELRPVDDPTSWGPRERTLAGLRTVAHVEKGTYRLHTLGGDRTFLPGVNLGSTTPGHQPGELALSAADYRRWFPLMIRVGFRVLRVYTIHPPAFYTELARFNRANPDTPLYLVQGVYLPDESYATRGLYDRNVTESFTAELKDAVAAVHGDLTRPPRPGRASGTWETSVAPWLAGWIVGTELDPWAVRSTDFDRRTAPAHHGRYFTSAPGATATERWLTARMDELAGAEAARGNTAPIAFMNWPTLDPLSHPTEPLEGEDLVGVDANAIRPTAAWPGGTFASYHAYPFYPDFQRYEQGLRITRNGRADPYAGYIAALKRHHSGVPVVISEFGVSSCLGVARTAPLGRDQGGHSEAEALRIDADLFRVLHEQDVAGGFLFSWSDEWFKLSWNTVRRQLPADRRQNWHDVLTNEQFYGVLATDAAVKGHSDPWTITDGNPRGKVAVDPSWVYLTVDLPEDRDPASALRLGFDVVEGGAPTLPGSTLRDEVSDYSVVLDAAALAGRDTGTAIVRVRRALDPVAVDVPVLAAKRPTCDRWCSQVLVGNGETSIRGTERIRPAEFTEVGRLRRGSWAPEEKDYDSRSTWRVDRNRVTLRLPWGLLGLSDPSSRSALVIHGETASSVQIQRIGVLGELGSRRFTTAGFTWDPWQVPDYVERLKPGSAPLVEALARARGL